MTGAFFVTPLKFGSHLFSDALKAPLPPCWPEKPEKPEAEAPAEEEAPVEEEAPAEVEEVEVIPDPPTQHMTWVMCLDSTLTSHDFVDHIPWLRTQASVLEERLVKADQQEYLKHRAVEEKFEATEEVIELIDEIKNLSHLVHIERELLLKYHAIALAFGIDGTSLVLVHNGKPSWRKILAAFCTLKIPIEVKDSVALKALVDEVAESFPSAVSKVLKVLADSTTPAAPEEPAAEKEEPKDAA